MSTTTTIINRKCSNCTTFGQLFLRKVIEIDATRCLDFSSKCTKSVWRPGPLREVTALLQTPSWIQGVLLLTGGEERGRKGKGKGRGGREVEGERAQFCILIWGDRSP